MKIRTRVADPAGNITFFVLDKADRKDYPWIANQLLCIEEFHGEQVGFLEEREDGSVHMQMMGGEFCGNATRSFGYLMSMTSREKPKEIYVDVSGSDRPLKVEIDFEQGKCKTSMPLPREIRSLDAGDGKKLDMVVFDGICHIIVKEEPWSEEQVERTLKKVQEQCPSDAYGFMFLEGEKMTPVVYVRETGSLVWESSCGSGSMGAAVYLSKDSGDGEFTCSLRQPGGVIEASVKREGGRVTACAMGGPVSISEEMVLQIEEQKG